MYNLYVQVAGGEGSVERAVDVSPNEMEVDESGHRASGPSAGEPVTPREMGVPSGGGEEAVAPRVPPVPATPTQAEQDEHHATGHAANRSWCEHCVRGRGRASPHAIVSEGELPEVGVDYGYLGRRIPSDDFGVQVQTHWVPGCDAGAGEGHECLCSSLLYWMAAGFRIETIVVEVRQ